MFTDLDLLHGDPSAVADYLGVSLRTLARYKSRPDSMPEACRKLLRLRLCGDLAALLGSAWEGFSFGRDGLLYVPGWRNGMAPERIRAMFFVNQEAAALRADLKVARADLWAARQVRRYTAAPISERTKP